MGRYVAGQCTKIAFVETPTPHFPSYTPLLSWPEPRHNSPVRTCLFRHQFVSCRPSTRLLNISIRCVNEPSFVSRRIPTPSREGSRLRLARERSSKRKVNCRGLHRISNTKRGRRKHPPPGTIIDSPMPWCTQLVNSLLPQVVFALFQRYTVDTTRPLRLL